MSNNAILTDKEKLEKVKEIIEENLFAVMTSYALEMSIHESPKLERYVELKELLGIDQGICMEKAKNYDEFKLKQPERYKLLMDKLDNQMLKLHATQEAPFHRGLNISTYMFMIAFFPLLCFDVSAKMPSTEYYKMLKDVDKYRFFSG